MITSKLLSVLSVVCAMSIAACAQAGDPKTMRAPGAAPPSMPDFETLEDGEIGLKRHCVRKRPILDVVKEEWRTGQCDVLLTDIKSTDCQPGIGHSLDDRHLAVVPNGRGSYTVVIKSADGKDDLAFDARAAERIGTPTGMARWLKARDIAWGTAHYDVYLYLVDQPPSSGKRLKRWRIEFFNVDNGCQRYEPEVEGIESEVDSDGTCSNKSDMNTLQSPIGEGTGTQAAGGACSS